MKTINHILVGAIAGTVLGTLATLLYPNHRRTLERYTRQSQGLGKKAAEYVENFINGRVINRAPRSEFTKGLLGFFIGAALTSMLTPLSNKRFRQRLISAYYELSDRTHHAVSALSNGSTIVHRAARMAAHPAKKQRRTIRTKH